VFISVLIVLERGLIFEERRQRPRAGSFLGRRGFWDPYSDIPCLFLNRGVVMPIRKYHLEKDRENRISICDRKISGFRNLRWKDFMKMRERDPHKICIFCVNSDQVLRKEILSQIKREDPNNIFIKIVEKMEVVP
jgi:hypothetical protein